MSGTGDKLKGNLNQLQGAVKQEYGRQTGDEEVFAEGQKDEAKGKAQGIVGTVKNAADDIKRKVSE